MANQSQTGFRPYGNNGSTSTQCKRVRIASNNATAIFKGDCMKITAAGVWGLATAGAGVSTVAQGAEYFDSTINGRRANPYLPATTTYTGTTFDDHGETDESFVLVIADPVGTRFQAQYSGGTPALADITKNANFVASAGSTVNGLSGHTINQATLAANAALDFFLMDWKHSVDNDMTTTNAKVIVQINVGLVPPFTGTSGVIGT